MLSRLKVRDCNKKNIYLKMDKFGCVYTSMGNYKLCRKIPNTQHVSPECEIVNKHCIEKGMMPKKNHELSESPNLKSPNLKSSNLKSSNLKSSKLKSSKLKSSKLKSSKLESSKLESSNVESFKFESVDFEPTRLKTQSKDIYISGPVAVSIGSYMGKIYYLFSDIHYSMMEGCSRPCRNFDTRTFNTGHDDIDNCYEIERLIEEIIRRNNGYVDVFLEVPFLSIYRPARSFMAEQTESMGYLYKTLTFFWPCIDRLSGEVCPYPNARFHYLDLRISFNYDQNLTVDAYLLDTLYKQSFQRFYDWKNNMDWLNDIHTLYKYFYEVLPNQQTRHQQLFSLILTSTNYKNDILNLLRDIPLNTAEIFQSLVNVLLYPKNVVTRNTGVYSRIGAQFYGLQHEGQKDLSDKMIKFLEDEYVKKRLTVNNLKIWFQVYTAIGRPNFTSLLKQLSKTQINYHLSEALYFAAYTLGRMFRKFSSQHNSNKIILYAGRQHIKVIDDFFTHILGVNFDYEPYYGNTYIPTSPSRCLKLPRDKFFSI